MTGGAGHPVIPSSPDLLCVGHWPAIYEIKYHWIIPTAGRYFAQPTPIIMAAQDETDVKSGDSTKLETRVSREEVDLIKSSDSPTRPKRTTRQSVGSDQSIDNSPMHPHQHPRGGNRGSAGSSPMWDRKVSSDGSHGAASSTPGRSRLKQVTRGDETVDDGPAIPKFGDWDDSDPTAGEGYTQLFNKAREDRHNGGGKSPMITTENANFYGQNRHANDNKKGCGCFPWGRK